MREDLINITPDELRQGFRDLAVGLGPTGESQVLVEGVLDERVREAVMPGRVG